MDGKCEKVSEHIKQLFITPLVLGMLTANNTFRLEIYISKTAAGGPLFQLMQGNEC